eukprot:1905832-Pyramimonas_sp.AAC.1
MVPYSPRRAFWSTSSSASPLPRTYPPIQPDRHGHRWTWPSRLGSPLGPQGCRPRKGGGRRRSQ